jgi:hypothetical protein
MNDDSAEKRARPAAIPKQNKSRLPRILALLFILLVPCVAVLDVPLFDRLHPRVFGVPFIDAYLLLWVIALVPFLFLASRLLPSRDDP